MNPDTRVSVHCYEGDKQQVIDMLPAYTHHGCPVTIISPDDSRVELPAVPGLLDCAFGGKRQSMGQLSLDRQREHMRMLLGYPEHFFLMNDADSVCLSPELPAYLYAEPDILWSNLVYDPIPAQQRGYAPGFPRLAFQPPYFLSRPTIERLLAVAEGVVANPVMPYIDHYMVQLSVKAGLVWKGFPDGVSTGISIEPGKMELAQVEVRHKGAVFIHSVKDRMFLDPLLRAHAAWREDYRGAGDPRLSANTDTTADVRPVGQELALTLRIRRDSDHVYRSAPAAPAPRRTPQHILARQEWERQQQRRGLKA